MHYGMHSFVCSFSPLNISLYDFINVVVCTCSFFTLFMVWYSIVWKKPSQFVFSTVDEHLVCYQSRTKIITILFPATQASLFLCQDPVCHLKENFQSSKTKLQPCPPLVHCYHKTNNMLINNVSSNASLIAFYFAGFSFKHKRFLVFLQYLISIKASIPNDFSKEKKSYMLDKNLYTK